MVEKLAFKHAAGGASATRHLLAAEIGCYGTLKAKKRLLKTFLALPGPLSPSCYIGRLVTIQSKM
jgi:hypothetical protein